MVFCSFIVVSRNSTERSHALRYKAVVGVVGMLGTLDLFWVETWIQLVWLFLGDKSMEGLMSPVSQSGERFMQDSCKQM